MWLGARGNESSTIREVKSAKYQHTFWHSVHVWSRSGTHLRSWGSVCRCGPGGTCRLAAYPAISVPLLQRALCDWPAETSWVSLLAPQQRLDHSWKGGVKMKQIVISAFFPYKYGQTRFFKELPSFIWRNVTHFLFATWSCRLLSRRREWIPSIYICWKKTLYGYYGI